MEWLSQSQTAFNIVGVLASTLFSVMTLVGVLIKLWGTAKRSIASIIDEKLHEFKTEMLLQQDKIFVFISKTTEQYLEKYDKMQENIHAVDTQVISLCVKMEGQINLCEERHKPWDGRERRTNRAVKKR